MSGKEAWIHWFNGDSSKGLFQPLKQFTKDMIRNDRRRYSERAVLALAFSKYNCYEEFEREYQGYTDTYSKLLKEVRKRKRENTI